MACDITKGRLDTPCKTGVGGVKAFEVSFVTLMSYKPLTFWVNMLKTVVLSVTFISNIL